MAVYVDRIREYDMDHATAQTRRVGNKWCHMVADSLNELHALAREIGMRGEWAQLPPKHRRAHYDLTPSRRAAAVKLGAIEVDRIPRAGEGA